MTDSQKLPKMIGSRGSHDGIMQALRELPRGKVLDAPAGNGRLSVFMKDLGFEVYCTDIESRELPQLGFPFKQADLNQPLPYDDTSFDVVVCANALHRIANFRGALREFSRVLKPGGSLLISVNNYANIAKRLKFLLYGSLSETNNELTHNQSTDDPLANIRQSLFYPAIENGLRQSGLRVLSVKAQSRRLNHYLLSPFALLVYLLSFLTSPKSRKRNSLATSRGAAVNFGGKSIFIHTVKE